MGGHRGAGSTGMGTGDAMHAGPLVGALSCHAESPSPAPAPSPIPTPSPTPASVDGSVDEEPRFANGPLREFRLLLGRAIQQTSRDHVVNVSYQRYPSAVSLSCM